MPSLQALKRPFRRFSEGKWDQLSRLELVLVYPCWVVYLAIRELIQDLGLVRASSLAFTTVLSVVPTLTVATTLLGTSGSGQKQLLKIFQDYLLPYAGPEIILHVQHFIVAQSGAVGSIGSIILIVLGVALFNNIEHTFNDIWRIEKKRAFLNKFLTFYALITLGPLLVTISIVQTARFQFTGIEQIPFLASLGNKFLSVGLAMTVFALANKMLPNTRVEWKPAIISGLVTAIAFEVTKVGFNFYIDTFLIENYERVYGAIYLVPIFLVWVYICWIIVLFGAEMTFTIQHIKSLLIPEKVRKLAKKTSSTFNPLVAIEVFFPIAKAFKLQQEPITQQRIAAHASIPLPLAEAVINALALENLIREVFLDSETNKPAYIPARPLHDIQLLDLVHACRQPEPHEEDSRDIITTLRQLHQDHELLLLKNISANALVDELDPQRTRLVTKAINARLHHAQDDPSPSTPNPPSHALLDQIRDELTTSNEPPSPIDALAQLNPTPETT